MVPPRGRGGGQEALGERLVVLCSRERYAYARRTANGFWFFFTYLRKMVKRGFRRVRRIKEKKSFDSVRDLFAKERENNISEQESYAQIVRDFVTNCFEATFRDRRLRSCLGSCRGLCLTFASTKHTTVTMASEEPSNRLYVGNIPWSTSVEELRGIFSQCGSISLVDIPTGRQGRSRGYGIVEYSNVQEAAAAIQQLDGA